MYSSVYLFLLNQKVQPINFGSSGKNYPILTCILLEGFSHQYVVMKTVLLEVVSSSVQKYTTT